MLPITLTIAAACALINLWLASRVVRLRAAKRVEVGDGGDPVMTRRMRAHANFTEYAPFVLILLGLIEMAKGSQTWLWAASFVFVFGRIAHAFGMDRSAPSVLRAGGILATWLVLLALAGYGLAIAYGAPALTTTLPG
ncbi:MAPEG family protein [Sphingomonas sp. XMGL2]|uniref:MAPEG family protein n=2 Tax=Sphingomonas quercus TaxID=2842451 RepID=A0ABS6BIJ1_9SPHN|nr:MAPEG family protein [Sphingomonas quercus]